MSSNNNHKNGNDHPYEDCHLGRITLNNLKKWKDGIHQVELSSDDVNTHEEVRLRSVRVARGLQTRGLGVGDVIVICGNTHNDICLPILAAFYIGSTVFPLSNTMTKIEVKRMLEQGTPKIIFCDPCMEEIFTRALQELNVHVEIVIFGDVHRESDTPHITPFSEFLKPTGNDDSFEVVDFDPDTTIALISCSSGTTGLPKGVCHTHKTLATSRRLGSKHRSRESGYLMSFSSYYWISAMFILLGTCMSGTPRLSCALSFSIDLFEKGLTKYKPHAIFLSPNALYNTIKSSTFDKMDFGGVKALILSGSYISESAMAMVKNKLKDGFVYLVYASSETGHVSINKGDKFGTVGKALPWINWKIVNMETRKEVNAGEQGELCVKTETIFKCYLNNPEATKAAFDEDGYYKTGDLFTYDKDGFLYYVDRVKEVMKYRNYQVTPTEVETEIRKLPEVLQVCVVGRKHEEDGERPVAFVQKSKGSNLTEQDIKDVVKNSLAEHKQLSGGVVFMKTLPETNSGKINRSFMKKLAQEIVAN